MTLLKPWTNITSSWHLHLAYQRWCFAMTTHPDVFIIQTQNTQDLSSTPHASVIPFKSSRNFSGPFSPQDKNLPNIHQPVLLISCTLPHLEIIARNSWCPLWSSSCQSGAWSTMNFWIFLFHACWPINFLQ